MEISSPASHIGSSLAEALGLSSPGAQRIAQNQWQQAAGSGQGGTGGSAEAVVPGGRIAAAQQAGEAGELHPRGRFVNLRV